MTSLHGLHFDVFSIPHGKVEPLPLPTDGGQPSHPLLFPANWASEAEIETRWQTDVTAPANGPREAVALMRRPTRTLRARMTAMAKKEAFSLLQSIRQSASTEAPAPLYTDAVRVWEAAWLDANTLEIEGQFSFGRFFVDGRVVVFSHLHQHDDRDKYPIFGTLVSVTRDKCVIAVESGFPPTLAQHREVDTTDQVAPCIDVEIASTTSTKALSDGVVDVDMTWTEVEGPSTLPALWPPFSEAEDAWTIHGVAERIDFAGALLPLFPATVDWADGVDISIENPAESTALGRSRILQPTSPIVHKFSATVTAATRQEAWSAMRFFDSARGREGVFCFPHPIDALDVVTRDSTFLEIRSISSLAALRSQFKYLYVRQSDGTKKVVQITSVTTFGSNYRLNWASPMAGYANIVEARQAFRCAFAADVLKERWLTTGVVQFALDIEEIPDASDVALPTGLFDFSVDVEDPVRSVDGCSLFLRAGAECYDENDQKSTNWPGLHFRVSKVLDISKSTFQKGAFRKYAEYSGSAGRALVRPFTDAYFGSQPVFLNTQLSLKLSAAPAQNPYSSIWGLTGWTFFIVFAPKSGVTSSDPEEQLLRIDGSNIGLRIRLGGNVGPANGSIRFDGTDFPALAPMADVGQARVLAVRLNFLTSDIQAWLDGEPWITKATFTTPFNPSGTITQADLGVSAASNTALTSTFLRSTFSGGVQRLVTAAMAHYRFALTTNEMRAVHAGLASIYNTRATQSVIEVL